MQMLTASFLRFLPRRQGLFGMALPAALAVWAATGPLGQAIAQTNSLTQAAGPTTGVTTRDALPEGKPLPGSAANQLIEKIRVDDADVRIDEGRFGGETRTITVTPKGGFPAYDVRPSTGRSTWKILGF